MNEEFEAVIMNTYAELCIMWRVAHVTDQRQAADYDAKLKSLEAVVAAFDLTTPADGENTAPAAATQPAAESKPAPSKPATTPRSNVPSTGQTDVPSGPPASSGMMLED